MENNTTLRQPTSFDVPIVRLFLGLPVELSLFHAAACGPRFVRRGEWPPQRRPLRRRVRRRDGGVRLDVGHVADCPAGVALVLEVGQVADQVRLHLSRTSSILSGGHLLDVLVGGGMVLIVVVGDVGGVGGLLGARVGLRSLLQFRKWDGYGISLLSHCQLRNPPLLSLP